MPELDEVVIPTGPDELNRCFDDQKFMQRIVTDKDKLTEFVTTYAKVVMDKHEEVATQVREQVDRTLAAWLKENGEVARPDLRPDSGPTPAATLDGTKIYNAHAMGAAIDSEVDSSADFFRLIWHNSNRTAADQTRLQKIRNAFGSSVPSEGGFLIPETLRSEMLRVSLETAIVRPRARVIPMETLRVPFPAVDSTSNASSVYGGVVGYWTEEGAALTSSAASFDRVVLDAKKLTTYTEVPNELISDSAISFQAFLDQIFPEAMGFYEDYAYLVGSGVGQPLGAIKGPGVISVAKQTNQTAATIVWENIVDMYCRMLPSSLMRAVWVCSIDTLPQLMTMSMGVGTGGVPVYIPANGAAGAPYGTLLGRPVIFTEKVPTLGTVGDINFVDFGFYLIGDRQVMSAMSSPHFKFQNDQTAYRIINRVDGTPWLQSEITPKNSGNTLSYCVSLATRS